MACARTSSLTRLKKCNCSRKRTLLDAVKVSTKGARVAAEVSASPASAARVTWAFFATRPGGGPKKEPEVKKTTGKSSTDSK